MPTIAALPITTAKMMNNAVRLLITRPPGPVGSVVHFDRCDPDCGFDIIVGPYFETYGTTFGIDL